MGVGGKEGGGVVSAWVRAQEVAWSCFTLDNYKVGLGVG